MTIAKLTQSFILLPSSSSITGENTNILDDFLWDNMASRSNRNIITDGSITGTAGGSSKTQNVDPTDDEGAATTADSKQESEIAEETDDEEDDDDDEEIEDRGTPTSFDHSSTGTAVLPVEMSSEQTSTQPLLPPPSKGATTNAASVVYQRPSDWKLFPRWNSSTGIPIQPLMEFIYGVAYNNASTIETSTIRNMFPETLYVFDFQGVYYSYNIRNRTQKTFINDRVKPTEMIMNLAHQTLISHVKGLQTLQQEYKKQFSGAPFLLQAAGNSNTSSLGKPPQSLLKLRHQIKKMEKKWQRLQLLIQEKGSFPFLAWFGDFTACNHLNWKRPIRSNDVSSPTYTYESIPLFTTCAQIRCNHAFPLPTYKTIQGSLQSTFQWKKRMQEYQEQYPVELNEKISKLVWRGSLTGDIQNYTNVRWLLCKYVTEAPAWERQFYDIGLTKIPERHVKVPLNLTVVGDLVPGIFPMAAFQNYRAILDIDGNSWSSRFGSLLCYHSVILKVEPRYVDYFHYASLIPNVHYVPVHYNLSNLYSQTLYVMDPKNAADIQRIIHNANAWCQTNMVYSKIANDYLTIFDQYVGYLDMASASSTDASNWKTIWNHDKEHKIFPNQELFNMAPLQRKRRV